eukprot:3221959-Pleurochrysis_carterae.AAC.1
MPSWRRRERNSGKFGGWVRTALFWRNTNIRRRHGVGGEAEEGGEGTWSRSNDAEMAFHTTSKIALMLSCFSYQPGNLLS